MPFFLKSKKRMMELKQLSLELMLLEKREKSKRDSKPKPKKRTNCLRLSSALSQ